MATAQIILATRGELVSGTAYFESSRQVEVNDSGEWLIRGSFHDGVVAWDGVLGSGGFVWKTGDPTPASTIPGGALDEIDSVRINASGDVAMAGELNSPANYHDAVFWNGELVMEFGTEAVSTTGAPLGSTWAILYSVRSNALGQLLVHGRVDEAGPGFVLDDVITRLDLDANGAVVSSTPIVLGAIPGTVGGNNFEIDRAWHGMTMNDLGDVVFSTFLNGPTGAATYLWSGGAFTTIAAPGMPTSFDPSRNWGSLSGNAVDINNNGDYVMLALAGTGSGSDELFLVKNGALFKSPGDPVPGLAPYVFADPLFGCCAFRGRWAHIDEYGSVFYLGHWDGPIDSLSNGLFVDDELLLQSGVSAVDGTTIRQFFDTPTGIDVSDNGRYVIAHVRLSDLRQVVLLYDLTGASAFCYGDGGTSPGCTDCPCGNNAPSGSAGGCINSRGTSAKLMASGRANTTNDTLRFEVQGATASSFGILMSADDQLPSMGVCQPGSGIAAFVFDGLRCVGGAVQRHGSRATDTNGDIGIPNNIWGPPSGPVGGIAANGGFVSGQTRHFQCVYREAPTAGCGTGQNTTNAVSVTF